MNAYLFVIQSRAYRRETLSLRTRLERSAARRKESGEQFKQKQMTALRRKWK